jgi:hypothetical protein
MPTRLSRKILQYAPALLVTGVVTFSLALTLYAGASRSASHTPASASHALQIPAGLGAKAAVRPTGPGEVRVLAPGESFIPGLGVHWMTATGVNVPPGASLATSASAAQAISFAAKTGLPGSFKITESPVATLAVFSNDVKGTQQTDGTVKLDEQNLLAWVLRYPNVPIVRHGPAVPNASQAPPGPTTCDFYFVVDAQAIVLKEAFQSCDRQVG